MIKCAAQEGEKSGNKESLFIGVILLFFDFVIKYKLAFYDRLEVLSGD